MFAQWSDNGAPSHTITVPADPATVTATYSLQYRLQLIVQPVSGGSMTAMPPSPDGYYAPGTAVLVTALPKTEYRFAGFGGALKGMTNPQTVMMTMRTL